MSDLTILFLTINRMPARWTEYHFNTLLEAAGDNPIIAISAEPMSHPKIEQNIIQKPPFNYVNIYKQIMIGCEHSRTRYVGIAEDDTLYSHAHFNSFRPKDDEIAYDMHRWQVYWWNNEIMSLRRRYSNFHMIGPTAYVKDALKERFDKWGDDWPLNGQGELARPRTERFLKVARRKSVEYCSFIGVLNVAHKKAIDERERMRKKAHAPICANSVPKWGSPKDILKHLE